MRDWSELAAKNVASRRAVVPVIVNRGVGIRGRGRGARGVVGGRERGRGTPPRRGVVGGRGESSRGRGIGFLASCNEF